MALITPNFKDVADLKPLEGTYDMTVEACDVGVSAAGNNKIQLSLLVNLSNGKTTKRTSHLPIDGKGAFRFENFLRSIGFSDDADRIRAGQDVAINTDAFIGQSLRGIFALDKQDSDRDSLQKFLKP
jgi:hypothetical protein